MRRILIIILLGALLIGTIGAVLWFLRIRSAEPPGPSPEAVEQARTELEQAVAACAGDEACIEETAKHYAVLSSAASFCGQIEDAEARDECVLAVAVRQGNGELCGQLSDDGRAGACRDAVAAKKAREAGSPESCGQIADDERLLACYLVTLGGGIDRGACGGLIDRAAEVCLAVVISNQAAAASDPALCDEIADERLRFLCAGGDEGNAPLPFAPLDADGDGLSDDQERELGTDPNTADTDGDGFDDGTEVKNGFNPLGSGAR